MMTRAYLAVLLLAGCRSELNPAYCAAHPADDRCTQAGLDGAQGSDAGPMLDAAEAVCVGQGKFQACLRTLPQPITLSADIQTDGNQCLAKADEPIGWTASQGQPDACFIVGSTVQITGTLTVRGTRPLVIVATDTITLTGTLDVSARVGKTFVPAGFDPANCDPFGTTPMNATNGGGGGAGGSLGAVGGNGGKGGNNATAGTATLPAMQVTTLHAGCPGQAGGTGDGMGTPNLASAGGFGGGALALIAGTKISFAANSVINASGAAGTAGNHRTGGGGGGSGGMIALWAPMFQVGTSTEIFANGGGGSSGGTNSSDGVDGNDPPYAPPNPNIPGNGGVLGGAGNGGNGYALDLDPQVGTTGNSGNGGGGGGGGAGIVFANMAIGANATVSPPATGI